jgi:hypothetical protein
VRQEHPGPLSKSEIRTGPVGPVVGMGAVLVVSLLSWAFAGNSGPNFKLHVSNAEQALPGVGPRLLFPYRGTQRWSITGLSCTEAQRLGLEAARG